MEWDENLLHKTLKQLRLFGDDTTLIECKRAKEGTPKNLGETLCAFANMPEGGTILLGVDERSGFRVTGVPDPAQLEKSVTSLCRNAVYPAPQVSFTHIKAYGKDVVAVTVHSLQPSEKPAHYRGTAYLRQADGDYAMNSNDFRMLQISALHSSERENFDRRVLPGTSIAELDSTLLDTYLRNVRRNSTRLSKIDDDARLLQILNITDSDGNLRLGGLYALGYFPQTTEPALGATVAVRLARTDSLKRNQNLKDLEGPLPELINEAMLWIQQNTNTVTAYKPNGHMVDRPEFPPSAIREVVANAFVHRDLGPTLDVGKRVDIRVSDKALIIQNPGGLQGLSAAQLESSELTKAAVNQRLYEIAKNLHTDDGQRVIEGEGGGIREVLAAVHEARLHPPKFIDTGTQFKVIFPRGERFNEEEKEWLDSHEITLNAMQEDLLIALREGARISFSYLCREYHYLSEKALRSAVNQLIERDIIVETDEGLALYNFAFSPKEKREAQPDREVTRVPNDLSKLGKNVPIVYNLLFSSDSLTLKDILFRTELTENQVRYALGPLLEQKLVEMRGGQGNRGTQYYIPR
ncbi:RNA-binding domain-containing protein [Arcanobacterium haemolyticum]